MRKLFVVFCIFFLWNTVAFSQGIYFDQPTSSTVLELYHGEINVDYHMYCSESLEVYHYYAKLTFPDNTQTNWMIGQSGGWTTYQNGYHQIQGKADVYNVLTYQTYTAYRSPFSFSVTGDENQALSSFISGPESLDTSQDGNYDCGAVGGT